MLERGVENPAVAADDLARAPRTGADDLVSWHRQRGPREACH